jgi:hypothetical protein
LDSFDEIQWSERSGDGYRGQLSQGIVSGPGLASGEIAVELGIIVGEGLVGGIIGFACGIASDDSSSGSGDESERPAGETGESWESGPPGEP